MLDVARDVIARTAQKTTAPLPRAKPPAKERWGRRAPLLPALIFAIIVTQLPFVVTLIVSFMDWNAYYPDERGFAGFSNYASVLTDVNMRRAILVTVILTAVVVLVSLLLGMGIALLLVGWATKSGAVGKLFDAVMDSVIGRVK